MKRLEKSNILKGTLQSPVTLAIVAHLRANGPTRLVDLDTALAQIDGYAPSAPSTANTRLVRTLNKLRQANHIHRLLRNDQMLWAAGPHPGTVDPAAEEAAHQVVATVVQAARYDLMHAAAYVPDAAPALRPGALNFMRVATVGQRC